MTIGALLRLVRPPNVFTAVADGLAGLLVLWGLGLAVPDRACLTLVASACLYLSGIVTTTSSIAPSTRASGRRGRSRAARSAPGWRR